MIRILTEKSRHWLAPSIVKCVELVSLNSPYRARQTEPPSRGEYQLDASVVTGPTVSECGAPGHCRPVRGSGLSRISGCLRHGARELEL